MVKVVVHNRDNFEVAIRIFKKKAQKEGLVREAKRRRMFEKPCEMRKRKREENLSRKKSKRNN